MGSYNHVTMGSENVLWLTGKQITESLLHKNCFQGTAAAYRSHPMLVGGGVGVERDGSTGELHGGTFLRMLGEAEWLLLIGTMESVFPVHGFVVIPAILLLLLLLL